MSIPILAFHAIGDAPAPLAYPLDDFRRLVDALVGAGAQTLRVGEAYAAMRQQRVPPGAVVLTFDDAYESILQTVPILADAGLSATVYVPTAHLGDRNTWDGPMGDDLTIVDRSGLRSLHAAGWEIGSHAHRHEQVTGRDVAELHADLDRSIATIADITGEAPTTFAYPYGASDQAGQAAVAGRFATAVTIGADYSTRLDPPHLLRRIDAWYLRPPSVGATLFDWRGQLLVGGRRLGRRAGSIVRKVRP